MSISPSAFSLTTVVVIDVLSVVFNIGLSIYLLTEYSDIYVVIQHVSTFTFIVIGNIVYIKNVIDKQTIALSNRITKHRNEISNIIKETSGVRLVGSAADAISEIHKLSTSAIEIYNTHFVSTSKPRPNYPPEATDMLINSFINVVKNKGTVIDFYGGVKNSDALRQHEEKLIPAVKAADEETDEITYYHPIRVDITIPVVNFIILTLGDMENRNTKKVVYFGWGGHSHGSSLGEIVCSTDPSICKIFGDIVDSVDRYWD